MKIRKPFDLCLSVFLVWGVQCGVGKYASGVIAIWRYDTECTPISHVPFAIKKSGRYCFTKDLEAPESGNAIIVQSSFVTIDMNGYKLYRKPSTLQGVGVIGNGFSNILVFNGTIDGFQVGVVLSSELPNGFHELYRMTISNCGETGAKLKGRAIRVTFSSFSNIGGGGIPEIVHTHGLIVSGPGAVIRNNTFYEVRGNNVTKMSEGVSLALSGHINGAIIQENRFENSSLRLKPPIRWVGPSPSTYAVWLGGDGIGNATVVGNQFKNFVNGVVPDWNVSAVIMDNTFENTLVPLTPRARPSLRAFRKLPSGSSGYRPSDRDGKRPVGHVYAKGNQCYFEQDVFAPIAGIELLDECVADFDLGFQDVKTLLLGDHTT